LVQETTLQAELFERAPDLPEGMRYAAELISPDEERALLELLPALHFKEFEFHGFLGKRRTVSFGWHYDFNGGGLKQAGELPQFLLPLRERAAEFASIEPPALEHALLIEYRPGAGIGWHRDRPQFGDVVGISLLAPCTFRLRRKAGSRLVLGDSAFIGDSSGGGLSIASMMRLPNEGAPLLSTAVGSHRGPISR
jgi:alkylated DNA repair dioxygenase AlkB